MANMDGSNHTTLFTSQKGPVGEQTYNLMGEKVLTTGTGDLYALYYCRFFSPQASLLTTKESSCTGSAQEMGPLTAASWTE